MARYMLQLSRPALYILAALSGGDRHGYGIMQEVRRVSGGEVRLGPGTLYGALKRLLEEGLVEESTRRPADDDPRRRYYRLSRAGRRTLAEEARRLARLVDAATRHRPGLETP